jgi:hypothetical protein
MIQRRQVERAYADDARVSFSAMADLLNSNSTVQGGGGGRGGMAEGAVAGGVVTGGWVGPVHEGCDCAAHDGEREAQGDALTQMASTPDVLFFFLDVGASGLVEYLSVVEVRCSLFRPPRPPP